LGTLMAWVGPPPLGTRMIEMVSSGGDAAEIKKSSAVAPETRAGCDPPPGVGGRDRRAGSGRQRRGGADFRPGGPQRRRSGHHGADGPFSPVRTQKICQTSGRYSSRNQPPVQRGRMMGVRPCTNCCMGAKAVTFCCRLRNPDRINAASRGKPIA
jgi:hypothetical protein